MLFIPQEVKEKIDRLEDDNKHLQEENNRLKAEAVENMAQQKPSNAIWYVVAALIIAIAYIIFLHVKMANTSPAQAEETETIEATVYRDGEIVKWNAADFEGVVYRVQLGAYEGFDLNQYKENLDGLHQEDFDGFTKVSLGAFSQLADAQNFLQEMLRLDLKNVFIVAYKNNEPIGLIEAKNQE